MQFIVQQCGLWMGTICYLARDIVHCAGHGAGNLRWNLEVQKRTKRKYFRSVCSANKLGNNCQRLDLEIEGIANYNWYNKR